MGKQQLDDVEPPVCCSGEQGRIAGAIFVIGIGAGFEQPFDEFKVSAGNRAGERVVASAIGGGSVYVRAFFRQVACNFEIAEHRSQRNNGKSIVRK